MKSTCKTNKDGICEVCLRVVDLSTAARLGKPNAEKSLREILETSDDHNARLMTLGILSEIASLPGKEEPETRDSIIAFSSNPLNQQIVIEARRIFSIKI